MLGNRCSGSRWWRFAAAVLVSLALPAAACSGDADDSESTAAEEAEEGGSAVATDNLESGGVRAEQDAPAAEPAEEPAQEPADAGAGGQAGSSDTPSQLTPQDIGRSIIYVANVEVTVDDVALAASQAKTAIAGLGGLLFGEDTRTGERSRTVLEFKVLPEDFQEALARLEGLGRLDSQQVTADDVTERVVDLRSRVATAEVSVNRLREFLQGATDLEAIASLEQQLLQRETDLETLRGQLRTLEDQVSLATIFLTLTEAAPPAVEALAEFEVTFYDGSDDGARCPGVDELELDEGQDGTVCVQITNVGNVDLAELEIRDDRLDLRPRDFTFVDLGDDPLAPGETVTAWAAFTAPGEGASRVRPTAVAVDAEGENLRVGVEFSLIADYSLRFIEDDSLPGFTDALGGSWDFFKTLVGVVVLVAGAVVPFLWVPLLIWGLRVLWLRRVQRRNEQSQERRRDEAEVPPPPPPADVAAGEPMTNE